MSLPENGNYDSQKQPPRLEIDPSQPTPGELFFPGLYVNRHGVAVLSIADKAACRILNQILADPHVTDEEIRLLLQGVPEDTQLSLVVKTNPAQYVQNFTPFKTSATGEDFIPQIFHPELFGLQDLKVNTEKIYTDTPADLFYDFCSNYQPAFDSETDVEKKQKLSDYFAAIYTRLKHGGLLLVQLDENNPGYEEDTKKIKDHNKMVKFAIMGAKFAFESCKQFHYQKPDKTSGTLYIFTQEDYAQGEVNPYTSSAVKFPLDLANAMAEAERALALPEVLTR